MAINPRRISGAIGASTPPATGDQTATDMRAGLDRGVGQPHAPTINIHIGRIEVRAATRPAQSPPYQARPRQLQSLDSYLRQRNGERR